MREHFYEQLKSDRKCTIRLRDYYADRNGYLNENAFLDFTRYITEKNQDDLYLVCFNVDLRKSNAESMAVGDYTLRKFITSLQDYFVFRIGGEKFNALVTKEQMSELKAIFDAPNEKFKVYYGFVKDKPFCPKTPNEAKELIQQGIALMFSCKGEMLSDVSDKIIGDKGNTPKELQETKTRKFRSTMWYSVAQIKVYEPEYRCVDVLVYPTEYKDPLVSLPILVITDNKVNYNIKSGTNVQFGVCGLRFVVTCRFDRENHLNTSIYSLDKGKFDIKIETTEGVCIPANFGKRVGTNKEIYPIKENVTGMCDYILLDGGTPALNTDGYFISKTGLKYGVYMDKKCIDLVEIK